MPDAKLTVLTGSRIGVKAVYANVVYGNQGAYGTT